MIKLEKLILENDLLLFCVISSDGLITNCSAGFAKKLGYNLNDLVFKEYLDKLLLTDLGKQRGVGSALFNYFNSGKNEFTVTLLAKNQHKLHFKLYAQILENRELLLFCEDKSTDTFSKMDADKLISNLPLIIYKCDSSKSRKMQFVTEDIFTLTGYTAEEYLENPAINIPNTIHPDDKLMVEVLIEFCTMNHTHYNLEYRILNKKNEIRWVLERGRPYIKPGTDTVECLTGTFLEITAIKEKEVKVSAQVELIAKITETFPSIVMVYNFKLNRLVYSNFKLYEILGYGPDDITFHGSNFLQDLLHPADKALIEQAQRQIDFLKDEDVFESEYSLKHKMGHYIACYDRSVILQRDILGNPLEILTLLEDQTIKKKIMSDLEQERLRSVHSSKMATLGEMAGGIAHEINNPLAIIVGKVNQLRKLNTMNKMTPELMLDGLDKVDKNCFRISKIIQGLRSFSRSGENDPFVKNKLNVIIGDTLELCTETLNKNSIELKTDLKVDCELECRAVHVSQVILNLIHNARDAIESFEEKWILVSTQLINENEVEISVTDCGNGIPEEAQKKLMQPFYTTKELGKGTGLGLSIAHGIVQTHGGSFYYDKDSSHTKFIIRLPLIHTEQK